MRHPIRVSQWVLYSSVAVLFLASSGLARAQGASGGTCAATGAEAVTPEALHFLPGQVASYSGSGFAASCGVRVDFSGPGGPAPGRIVNTDRWGNFSFTYGLGSAPGRYRADLTGKGGAALDSVIVTAGDAAPEPSGIGPSPFAGNFGTADHGSGFSSSLIIPNNGTATGAAAGSTVIVSFSSGPANGGGPVSSCTDTQNNTYTLDVNLPSASNTRALAICSARIVHALGAADAITVHFPNNGNGQRATANVFTGLSPTPLDKTHTASSTSNTPNSGNTATTSQASELLVGAFAFNGTNFNTFSAGADYALTNASQGAGANTGLGSEWRVVSSTGAYAANGTLSVATAWLGAIATYKIGLSATHFSVSAPSSTTAGAPFTITVIALDQFSNIVQDYAGTVHFTSTDGQAVLPADSTLTGGGGDFSATLKTAGSKTITATDTANSAITGLATVNVGPTVATHFSVDGPDSSPSDDPVNITVTALDPFNNKATGYTGTVHFTSSDGLASLPPNSTLDNGSRHFFPRLRTAGNQTITATDTANSAINGTSGNINVVAGPAYRFVVTAQASVTSGTSFNFTVTAQDMFHNTAMGYAGTVHFTSTDGQAVLPADSTLTLGTGTFSATLKTVGGQTLTATDTLNSTIYGTSLSITVAPHFAVVAPGTATAGTPFDFTVTAQDGSNNTLTSYTGTVHFTTNFEFNPTLPADYTFQAGDAGTKTLSATLKHPAFLDRIITATDTANAFMTGTSNTIALGPGPLADFEISLFGAIDVHVGLPATFDATARDSYGNFKTDYTGTVHFHSNDSTATLPADWTFLPQEQGHHEFFVTFNTAGDWYLGVQDTSTPNYGLVSVHVLP